ncbi:MAG: phosphoadenylyl-sulfate reductase, partial [Gammaproteobacteria bacterium]|nr:phosphoadenylyl-sulfate reductase [Gammaproteobacteria bacterium]
ECCSIRKVQPLQRKLAGLAAWVTGQRRDQGASRTEIPSRQVDRAFSTPERELIKFNPLAAWTSEDVWDYIRRHDVPYNPLHDQGFLSIGCAPCTRPIQEGESERAGRWWWENEDEKECGLHSQNLRPIQVIQEQDS